jgi:hypothetical protein
VVLRQTVWIDHSVQGTLIFRVVLYWFIGIVYFGLGAACFQYYEHPQWSFERHASSLFQSIWPWLPSLILFLPLVLFDIARLSNLFVGPIYRLRLHLGELLDDPECRPLKFREDDFWQDLAEPIHSLQAEILRLRTEVAALQRALEGELQTDLTPAQLAQLVTQAGIDPELLRDVLSLTTQG